MILSDEYQTPKKYIIAAKGEIMSNWAIKKTTRPTTFIQWKGTNLCADFYCTCGEDFHIDEMFAYAVQCPHCNRRYELSTRLELRELPKDEIWDGCGIKLGFD